MCKKFHRCNILVYLFFTAVFIPVLCTAATITTYTYLHISGNRTDTAIKVITSTDTAQYIHYEDTRGIISESVCTPHFATKSWNVTNARDTTAMRISREGTKLHLNGTVKNRSVHRSKSIGNRPWFQAIEFALSPLNRSNYFGQSFWIVRLTDFSVHKMKFRKKKRSISTQDTVSTLLITPSGIPAQIWHATLCYSLKEGTFISSLFPSLIPGKKATVVKLVHVQ